MPTDLNLGKTIDESIQGQPYFNENAVKADKKFYIESYGCAMNFSDSEIVGSILNKEGYEPTRNIDEADLLLMNTCSIREKAEDTVRKRLKYFSTIKKKNKGALIGVLGCMAERLKTKFLEEEKLVDMVIGPDAYRDLPVLLSGANDGQRGINVLLSREETYADISPLRLDQSGITAFISIMRGCDNMCSFCVVPFTRGRERSRNSFTILAEAQDLIDRGYKEVTLLGQNVDSYKWENPETGENISFAQLIIMVAKLSPELRVRFSTSHPKDITDEVLFAIRDHENICNYIHLPAQSGNSRVLDLMNRTYDIEWYKAKVKRIYEVIPDCAISSDFITGFCTETEEEHKDTLDLIEFANYSMSYMFYYSERPGTLAERKFEDDITLEVKKRRLEEVIAAQRKSSVKFNDTYIGNTYRVLVDGTSKRSDDDYKGRNSQNQIILFPHNGKCKIGEYVNVKVHAATGMTAFGNLVD